MESRNYSMRETFMIRNRRKLHFPFEMDEDLKFIIDFIKK